jgi:carbonic anhydrase
VDRIRPAVEPLFRTKLRDDPDGLVAEAVRANVRVATDHLRHGSAILEQLVATEGLMIVGAEYSLETGIVDFFDVPRRKSDKVPKVVKRGADRSQK